MTTPGNQASALILQVCDFVSSDINLIPFINLCRVHGDDDGRLKCYTKFLEDDDEDGAFFYDAAHRLLQLVPFC